jgi:hypothetical protein
VRDEFLVTPQDAVTPRSPISFPLTPNSTVVQLEVGPGELHRLVPWRAAPSSGRACNSLSIRAAWGGEERCQFDGRTVAVDDDSFLILNNGRVCTTQIDAPQPVESFAIYFGPALVEHTYGAMTLSIEKALERGDAVVERSAEFLESLQPHDKLVSPVLRFIRLHVLRGVDDEAWYDEQLNFLLERMLTHRGGVDRAHRCAAAHPYQHASRDSTGASASRPTYLHSNYRQPLDLDSLGQGRMPVESITSCGCSRAFTASHRTNTCCAKRAKTALRLLQTTPLDVCEIASECRLRAAPCTAAPDAALDGAVAAPDSSGRIGPRARVIKSSIKKKGGGVAAPPPLSPYPLLLQSFTVHTEEGEATEGVVHLRERVAVAGIARGGAERRIVVQNVVDTQTDRCLIRNRPAARTDRNSSRAADDDRSGSPPRRPA